MSGTLVYRIQGHTSLGHWQSYHRLTWLVEWNGLICLFSANDMWSAGCQSLVYTTSSKFTVSRTELMAGMTPSPSWPAGQLRRARLPSRKSFCTSTTIKAEFGCKIWQGKIQKIIFHSRRASIIQLYNVKMILELTKFAVLIGSH